MYKPDTAKNEGNLAVIATSMKSIPVIPLLPLNALRRIVIIAGPRIVNPNAVIYELNSSFILYIKNPPIVINMTDSKNVSGVESQGMIRASMAFTSTGNNKRNPANSSKYIVAIENPWVASFMTYFWD